MPAFQHGEDQPDDSGWPTIDVAAQEEGAVSDSGPEPARRLPRLRIPKPQLRRASSAQELLAGDYDFIEAPQTRVQRAKQNLMLYVGVTPSEKALLEAYLRNLVTHVRLIVTVANIKGGGSKTTTAIYLGSFITELARLTGFVIPATENTETSTAAFNGGIPVDKALTVSELARLNQELKSYHLLSARIPRTPTGLRIVSEDRGGTVEPGDDFGLEQFLAIERTVYPNADFIAWDTGNDNVKIGSVVLEAARRSGLIIFTATAENPTSLEILPNTVLRYLTDTAVPPVDELAGDRPEMRISTAQKAASSIIVVSGVRNDGDAVKIYEKYVRGPAGMDAFNGQFMTIPWDDHIGGKDVVADMSKIHYRTYMAYLRLAIVAYERAAQLQGIDLSALEDGI